MKGQILVVDDEPGIRFGIAAYLGRQGWEVTEAASGEEMRSRLAEARPDVIVLDNRLPDATALELLPQLAESSAGVPVVVLTAFASIELAVQAIQAGASQFLTKPVDLPALAALVERLAASRRAELRSVVEQEQRRRRPLNPFIGVSRKIRELEELAHRVATSEATVLLVGETGTGKGVLARWLHEQSPRAEHPFVDLNCAGLGGELLQSELFGHEKGAFTGAISRKPGLVELAHRGTLFLDEIGDMDLAVQAKLLKVVEERRVRRVGGTVEMPVDVRIVAATHRDLGRQIEAARFRADLYHRIAAVPLYLPPLRQRREDIPELARALLASLHTGAAQSPELAPDAVARLQAHDWPGNIRELRNVLERAVLLTESVVLHASDLPLGQGAGQAEQALEAPTAHTPEAERWQRHNSEGAAGPYLRPLAEVEREHIARVLEAVGGNVAEAAQILKVPRSTLYQKIRQLGLKPAR